MFGRAKGRIVVKLTMHVRLWPQNMNDSMGLPARVQAYTNNGSKVKTVSSYVSVGKKVSFKGTVKLKSINQNVNTVDVLFEVQGPGYPYICEDNLESVELEIPNLHQKVMVPTYEFLHGNVALIRISRIPDGWNIEPLLNI